MVHKKIIKNMILVGFTIILSLIYYGLFSKPFETKHISQSKILNYVSNPTTITDKKSYTSNRLNLSFVIPEGYIVEERGTTILFTNDDKTIILGRSATDYDTIEEYMTFISEKNNFLLSQKQKIIMDTYSVVKGYISGKKIYFIYVDHYAYSISTSSPDLYDDLDRIAESFQYIPD